MGASPPAGPERDGDHVGHARAARGQAPSSGASLQTRSAAAHRSATSYLLAPRAHPVRSAGRPAIRPLLEDSPAPGPAATDRLRADVPSPRHLHSPFESRPGAPDAV